MSVISLILVLQIKIRIKPDRQCKGSNKIWETHSFWRNTFNNGAIWLQTLICNRLNPWYEMQAVWLSIQRNHSLDFIRPFLAMTMPEQAQHCPFGLTKPFSHECLLLWRLMYWRYHNSFDEPSLYYSIVCLHLVNRKRVRCMMLTSITSSSAYGSLNSEN